MSLRNFASRIWKTPFVHGMFVAVAGSVAGAVQTLMSSGVPQHAKDLLPVAYAGLGTVVVYLLKNGVMGGTNIN